MLSVEPQYITDNTGKKISVVIPLEDYNAIEETLYLVKSSANAARLSRALQNLKDKKLNKHDLIEI